jgi:tRNA-specific 2-thiouridylase
LQRFPKKEGDIIYVNPEHDDNYWTNANPTQIWCKGRSCTSSDSAYGGVTVGTHQGAYFYTIGQKYGLGLNFKAYIYRIDIKHNLLYVTDKDSEKLQTKTLIAKNWHRINTNQIEATSWKIRYRQNPPVPCTLQVYDTPWKGKYDYHTKSISEGGKVLVQFSEPQRAVAPGQIFVAYNGEICLWCGAIS